jgi:hypothetical protein
MGADFDASTPTLTLAATAEHADACAHLSEVLRRHFQSDGPGGDHGGDAVENEIAS